MLLEDENCCCICGRTVYRRHKGIPVYYCARCFAEYEEDILKRKPWVYYLMNAEKQRRKRRNRLGWARLVAWRGEDRAYARNEE